MSQSSLPFLGFGLGLRSEHFDDVLENKPDVDWFEVITENFLIDGGRPLYYLDRIRELYPMVLHSVSLSIGSTAPLDMKYLQAVKDLARRVNPAWISDHLCWTGAHNYNLHDLMPLPYTEEAVKHVSQRIKIVQDFLGCRILIENVSSYVTYKDSQMSEWEFITAIAEQADCLLLLDINNIYVSAFNHHFDPLDYINGVPKERVYQHHLAGHLNKGDYIIDTHDHPVIDLVWDLYAQAVKRFGPVSTMIERDDDIPPFEELFAEMEKARQIANDVMQSEQQGIYA